MTEFEELITEVVERLQATIDSLPDGMHSAAAAGTLQVGGRHISWSYDVHKLSASRLEVSVPIVY